MSNACGKSAKYSLSSGGFNYLLTRDGFVKKKKKKKKRKLFVRILEERKYRSLFPIGGRTSHLSSHCWLSVIFSIFLHLGCHRFPWEEAPLDTFFLLCGFRFDLNSDQATFTLLRLY